MKLDKRVTIRIDKETLDKIDVLAKLDNRSRSAIILKLLKKMLTMSDN